MKSIVPLALCFLAAALVPPGARAATASNQGNPSAERAVQQANESISALLAKDAPPGSALEARLAEQVTTSVRDLLDVDELGRRALRDHWPALSEEERRRYLHLLHTLIETNYVRGLRANLDYEVDYRGEEGSEEERMVRTAIRATRRGRPRTIEVDYRVRRLGERWRVFDVVTDGVGLVENYRAQFNKIIAAEGIGGLLARMSAKAKSLQ